MGSRSTTSRWSGLLMARARAMLLANCPFKEQLPGYWNSTTQISQSTTPTSSDFPVARIGKDRTISTTMWMDWEPSMRSQIHELVHPPSEKRISVTMKDFTRSMNTKDGSKKEGQGSQKKLLLTLRGSTLTKPKDPASLWIPTKPPSQSSLASRDPSRST